MYEYLLFIILHFPVGQHREPLQLSGTTTYTLAECKKQGPIFANWLAQEFVIVEWECRPVLKRM